MEHQPTNNRGAEEVSDRADNELNSVERDLRAKEHQSAVTLHTSLPSYPGVDEHTKMQLAKRASQATSPGVVAENHANSHVKPSHEQLEEMGNLRREHKNRTARLNSGESSHDSIDVEEEQPLGDFQERMHDFRYKDDLRNTAEDERLKKRRRSKWCLVAVIVVTAAVGVGVGVAVGLGGSSREGQEKPDKKKAFRECYMQSGSSDRFYRLSNVVTSALEWDASLVDATGSSRSAALCWLSEVDSWKWESFNGTEYEVVQRFALATVYFHFVGTTLDAGRHALAGSNRLDGVHVCEWDFVSCDGPSNRVTELVLEGMRLNKSIPEEVALLSDLVNLRLTRCQLTGSIPSSISILSQLEVLDLDFNQLTGTIPSEFGGFSELRTLLMAGNIIEGQIPVRLFQIPALIALECGGNQLTGTVPSTLENATGLHTLEMPLNRLTGTIPDISRLTNLRYLNLDNNELQGSFPDISRLTNLVTLMLRRNDLTGTIPSAIWFFPSLVTIQLAATLLTGTIPAAIGLLTSLQELNLGATKIAGSIPTTIGNLHLLRILDLAAVGGLSGTIPTEPARLSRLEILYLPSKSNLSGEIPDEVCNLPSPPDTGTIPQAEEEWDKPIGSTLHCN